MQKMKVFLLDTETTGFADKTNKNLLLEVYILCWDTGEEFETLIRPPQEQKKRIATLIANKMLVANITLAELEAAPYPSVIIPKMVKFIEEQSGDAQQIIFLAHNGGGEQLDASFVRKALVDTNIEVPAKWTFVNTIPIFRLLSPSDSSSTNEPMNMQHLMQKYHELFPNTIQKHRAKEDVVVMDKLLKHLIAKRTTTDPLQYIKQILLERFVIGNVPRL
jgi:DNA polymerase III epsilon subunit-like protein